MDKKPNIYDITCSLVTYKNDPVILKDAINSFLNTQLSVKLYLVDNSPVDTLRKILNDPRIEYVHNPSNPGFGSAHNLAIKQVVSGSSKYHLILNPDVYFEVGNIEKLFNFMESNKDVGHVMPKVLYPDGSIQYLCKNNPTPFILFVRRFLPGFLREKLAKRMEIYEYRDKNYDETMFDIPYLSGCFMFLRTETLKKVGLFDDRIFMYIEDADLTRRFLKISRTAYYPEAVIYHHFAKGSHKNWKLTWYSIHGAYIYFNKWGWFGPNKN